MEIDLNDNIYDLDKWFKNHHYRQITLRDDQLKAITCKIEEFVIRKIQEYSDHWAMIQAYQLGDVRIDYEGGLVDIILDGTLQIKNTLHNEVENGTFDQSVIRTSLEDKISYTKLYQTVESYLIEKDYPGALLALNAKQDFENYDPHFLVEKTTYAEIIQMESNLYSQGEQWTKLSSANQNRLTEIANTYNGLATSKARKILMVYFNLQFGPYPSKPSYDQLQFTSITRSIKKEGKIIKVYPNPAYNVLNIDFKEFDKMCTFRLLSIEGKLLKSKDLFNSKNSIDLSGLNNGLYFYEIMKEGKLLSSDKIIILE